MDDEKPIVKLLVEMKKHGLPDHLRAVSHKEYDGNQTCPSIDVEHGTCVAL